MRPLATLLVAVLSLSACDTVSLEDAEVDPRTVWVDGTYVGYATVNGRSFRHRFDLQGNPYDGSIRGVLTLDIAGDPDRKFDVRGTESGSGVDLMIGTFWPDGGAHQVLHLFGTADSTATTISGQMRWDNGGLGDYDDYSVTVSRAVQAARSR